MQAAPAPAAVPAKPAVAVSNNAQFLFDLRIKLEESLQRKSTDLATGGYAFRVDGASIEVQPMPNWSVTIYNLNADKADVDTPDFKKVLDVAAAQLGFDASQKGTTLSTGKLSLQAATKLGNTTIVRDPQNGTLTITPNQRRVIPQPAQPLAPQAPAAQPAPAPAPVKAPEPQGNTAPATDPAKQF